MTLPEPLQQVDRTWVQLRGQTLAYFAGCDYFRMASHPQVLAAAQEAISKYGLNVAASRWTTGNHELYDRLEKSLSEFFNSNALLVSNGYLTNLAVVRGLADEISAIYIDERSHGSLLDAARTVACEVIPFAHRVPNDLAGKISRAGTPLVMTDGVFAHDGSIAPLGEYARILPPNAYLLVDDSHGAGVLGERGRGTLEFCGVKCDRLIQTITLSKAFGSYGGAILSSKVILEKIVEQSSVIAGATPFPLPCAAAALAALQLLENSVHRQRLHDNMSRLDAGMKFPVRSINPKAGRDKLRQALLKRGIFPSEVQYGNNDAAFFRLAISSEHTRAQIEALSDALTEAA